MFADRYIQRVFKTKSHLCVGLDPIIEQFPRFLLKRAEQLYGKTPQGAAYAIWEFNRIIIDLVADKVPIVKPQLAYYEKYDHYGIEVFWKTVNYAQSKGLLVIADAKRGDIGSTSRAYAQAFFKNDKDQWTSSVSVDAMTVNPYLGSDGLDPFIESGAINGQGTIILVKTSNPSSGELQDQVVKSQDETISELVCNYIISRSTVKGQYGFANIGAVVGATYPRDLAHYRELLPHNLLLVPGIGYQGGDIQLITAAFNAQGLGAMINCSRAINYAYSDSSVSLEEMKIAIEQAVDHYNELINSALKKDNKYFL